MLINQLVTLVVTGTLVTPPYVNTNFGEISPYSSQDSGTYNVTLTISSDSGCTNSIIKQIIVNKSFSIYIPDAFSPNNDLKMTIICQLLMAQNLLNLA